jgi:GTP-binding protein HflX
MEAVYETFRQLGVQDKKIITVFNKIDQAEDTEYLKDKDADKVILISAKKQIHTEELLGLIEEMLMNGQIYIEKIFPYQDAGRIQSIRKYGTILTEEYRADGIFVEGYVPAEIIGTLE